MIVYDDFTGAFVDVENNRMQEICKKVQKQFNSYGFLSYHEWLKILFNYDRMRPDEKDKFNQKYGIFGNNCGWSIIGEDLCDIIDYNIWIIKERISKSKIVTVLHIAPTEKDES